MNFFNIGSINYDLIIQINDFPAPGETLLSENVRMTYGGKGLNQSIALAKAGLKIRHIGNVGSDGDEMLSFIKSYGVETAGINKKRDILTGTAYILVASHGQNSIIISKGANGCLNKKQIKNSLERAGKGDFLLLQNETPCIAEAVDIAFERGMKIILNPAPLSDEVKSYPLDKVSYLILNEIESEQLTGDKAPEEAIKTLKKLYPSAKSVITLGEQGVVFMMENSVVHRPALKTKAIDTTSAGDTFIGFFTASISKDNYIEKAVSIAQTAASLCVSRQGSAVSIPVWDEVMELL